MNSAGTNGSLNGGQGAQLTAGAVSWLESRGIWEETALRYGARSARYRDAAREVIAFPFIEDEKIVQEKFRELPKVKFWQHKDRRKIFMNADVLKDPALRREVDPEPLIIVEGELDLYSLLQHGFAFSVSVPDGAPPEQSISGRADGKSGEAEQSGKFEFVYEARELLRDIKQFVLAVDNDGPGRALSGHLVRLLGAGRCSFVEYPEGCKDLNDVLVKLGADAMADVIDAAKPYPVRGLYRLSDYPSVDRLQTMSSGWELLDRCFLPFPGEFIVVTGIPSHGKSTWVMNLLANLSTNYGIRSAVFSPEMRVVPSMRDMLRGIYTNKAYEAAATPEADAWIQDSFVFIGADPNQRGADDDFDLPWVMDRCQDAVLRDGVRLLLIDPWNEVEHAIPKGYSVTEYVGAAIRQLRKFALSYNLIVIVVAHPSKPDKRKNGSYLPPSLYDISDSAHWYNKADHGIVVHRNREDVTSIMVVKSRHREAGVRGNVRMKFDELTSRYYPLTDQKIPDDELD